MIAILNMELPKECQACQIFLWCYTTNDWKGYEHCPLIEIVHCEECKYYHTEFGEDECRWRTEESPNFDDFCSYGERRSE